VTAFRAFLASLFIVILFVGAHMWAKHALTAQIITAYPELDTTSVLDEVSRPAGKTGARRNQDWADPRVDLNGNEIDDAVGDYRVDPGGEMYERHAPDTALSHLGAARL
jgi:hypothetical protein